MQISCAVTAQLISSFVFASYKVQCVSFIDLKFQASGYFPWLFSLVCVGPGQKPRLLVLSSKGSFTCSVLYHYLVIAHLLLFCFWYNRTPEKEKKAKLDVRDVFDIEDQEDQELKPGICLQIVKFPAWGNSYMAS